MIGAIGVAVPARDEEATIGACLGSIADAAGATSVPVVVVVAADSCTDSTVEIARHVGDERAIELEIVTCRSGSAGIARKHAAARLTERFDELGVDPSGIWISCTDADTTVPRDWLTRQLEWAARGFDAVAGLVELPTDAPRDLRAAFHAAISSNGARHGHHHVHAANLGIRLSALVAAGGFPDVELGEDHALWAQLARNSASIVGSADTTVVTSSRLVGRSAGGFAAFLAELSDGLSDSTPEARSATATAAQAAERCTSIAISTVSRTFRAPNRPR